MGADARSASELFEAGSAALGSVGPTEAELGGTANVGTGGSTAGAPLSAEAEADADAGASPTAVDGSRPFPAIEIASPAWRTEA